VRRPDNLFQPHNDTGPERYPEVFEFLRARVGNNDGVRLLSFGCSVGDEVFTLRRYFPMAEITGMDISAGNIRSCRRRQRRQGDDRMRFVLAGTANAEASDFYDAILCMAVFRHGDLGAEHPPSCAHILTFAAFEDTVTDLARCLKPGGFFAIEHSNFRFCDTDLSEGFEVVASRPRNPADTSGTPQYGPDNARCEEDPAIQVVFRKL
jgi:SAM-dependent methyltransferase